MKHPAARLVAVAATAALLAAPAQAHAEPAGSADAARTLIESRIGEILDEQQIPGAAASLVVGGETVLAEGYGEAVAGGAPFGPDTAFYAGSVGKLFTTAAALQLVASGDLDLDADVNAVLTGFDVPDTYPGEPITLRHLLTHTSGFEDSIVGWSVWDAEDMPSLADFAAEHLPERLREPGTLVTYDNYDMVLAGLLVQEASGQPYEDYVAEHVFAPLGMDDSRVADAEPAKGADAAEGYRYDGGQVPTEGRLSPGAPAGPGILTTAADLARFTTAIVDRDPALGAGVAEQMTTRQFGVDDRMPGMGFSFQEFAGPGAGVWFKDGDVPGFHTAMAVVPADGVAVTVSFNGDGVDAAETSYAAKQLVTDVLAELGALPAATALAPAQDGDLDRYSGEYASTRTSRSDFTELTRVFSPITVEAADGALTTTGLAADPADGEQRWLPVGDGLFQEDGGTATLAFTADGLLLSSADPTVAFERVPWYDVALVHLAGLGLGALLLAAAFLTLTVNAAIRLIRRSPRKPLARTVNAWSAWLLGANALAVLGVLATVVSDPNLLMQQVATGSAGLTAATWLSLAAVALAAVTATTYAVVSARRQWQWRAAVGHGLTAAGGLGFAAALLALNLAAF